MHLKLSIWNLFLLMSSFFIHKIISNCTPAAQLWCIFSLTDSHIIFTNSLSTCRRSINLLCTRTSRWQHYRDKRASKRKQTRFLQNGSLRVAEFVFQALIRLRHLVSTLHPHFQWKVPKHLDRFMAVWGTSGSNSSLFPTVSSSNRHFIFYQITVKIWAINTAVSYFWSYYFVRTNQVLK